MKRNSFLVASLLVIFSFLVQYPVTASAPSLRPVYTQTAETNDRALESGNAVRTNQYRMSTAYVPPAALTETAIPEISAGQTKVEQADAVSEALTKVSENTEVVAPQQLSPFKIDTTMLPAIFSPFKEDKSVPVPDGTFCDANFVGAPISFTQTAELTLDDLLNQIHSRFGINFLMGPKIGDLPINIKTGSIPWNVLLRSQLFVSSVRAKCIGRNTIELVENSVLPKLQDAAEVETRFIKLKFLQPTSGGNVNVAGQSSSRGGGGQGCGGGGGGQSGGGQGGGSQGCGNFEKLIIEIEKILGIRSATESSLGGGAGQGGGGGQSRQTTEELRTNRSVSQVPGRNILVVRATDEEMAFINQIIARADRPPFQVVIKGLIYTANEDKLRDIGVQTSITEAGRDRSTGGIFGHTIGAAGTFFDFSTIIGSFDFSVQARALQQNGVISIKSRPFATVLDGDSTELTVGRQVPVLIQATNNLGGTPGTLQILQAANLLSVTPHVIDDENGNPVAVNLELQLEANDVDTSVISQGVPSVSVRSIQSRIILNMEQTAILGGFTVDSDSRSVSKTPGLGDIPILGELFKRRVRTSQINRLYFAISVSVIPYPGAIEPVKVPGATTDIPSITPEMLKRAEKAEPKQVVAPIKTGP